MTIAAFRDGQIGVETTAGTLVAATVHLNGKVAMNYAPRRELRDESRASMGGPNVYDDLSISSAGTYSGRCVVREQPYFWSAAMTGAPTISTPATGTLSRQWLFTQPLTTAPALKSLSLYTGDNTQALANAGTYVTRIVTSGSDVAPWTTQCDLIGWDQATGSFASIAALTGNALLDTSSIRNRLSKLYIDAVGGTIGTTQKTGTAFGFTHTWNSGVTFEYAMDGDVLTPTSINRDIPTCTLEITAKWNTSTVTEFGIWLSGATRLIRVQNEANTVIETTIARRARYDGAYVYTGFTPLDNERDGTTLGRLTLTAIEDPTYGKKTEVAFINTLTAL